MRDVKALAKTMNNKDYDWRTYFDSQGATFLHRIEVSVDAEREIICFIAYPISGEEDVSVLQIDPTFLRKYEENSFQWVADACEKVVTEAKKAREQKIMQEMQTLKGKKATPNIKTKDVEAKPRSKMETFALEIMFPAGIPITKPSKKDLAKFQREATKYANKEGELSKEAARIWAAEKEGPTFITSGYRTPEMQKEKAANVFGTKEYDEAIELVYRKLMGS
jgi:hypothetical protein